MGEGKLIISESVDSKPRPNIPGSLGYAEMKYVCKKK
jgi:hypothetical protein